MAPQKGQCAESARLRKTTLKVGSSGSAHSGRAVCLEGSKQDLSSVVMKVLEVKREIINGMHMVVS